MEKFLDKFKDSTKVFALALVWWTLSIITFGDFSSVFQWITLVVSIATMGLLINYKWRSDQDSKFFGPSFWYSFMTGVFLSLFELNPFTFTVRETVVSLTINTSFGIIGWWIAMLGFIPAANAYRRWRRNELKQEFEGDLQSLERDTKIQEITGKWWK
jgi:hypothetical protein